ncbi:hypothetical protein MMC24_001084 [Lignoscripta atroalba]|nr:hypothetical protein [Lignoscripta atroalba]
MERDLIAQADRSSDIGTALAKFIDRVPEWAVDITATVAACFSISSALRDLNIAIQHARPFDTPSDVRTVLKSLETTFNDIDRLFEGLGRQRNNVALDDAFLNVWLDIVEYFLDESKKTLCERLQLCEQFIRELTRIVDGYPPRWDFRDSRYRMEKLLVDQLARVERDFQAMTINSPGKATRRSFERRRPRQQTLEQPSNRLGPRRAAPQTPGSPGFEEYGFPPPVPDVPTSPTTTTFSTQSSSSNTVNSHWVPVVFEQSRPTTAFVTEGHVSSCFGEDMPGALSKLAQDYERLLELPFDNGALVVRLYIRSSDLRTRIHCKTTRSGRRTQSCLPISSLRIVREHSNLQLCRSSRSGRSRELWATMRFPSYERMILLFCTFLALKSQDTANPIRLVEDHLLRGEKPLFAGFETTVTLVNKIIDDNYVHALRLFRDEDSRGIRLQASIYRGEMEK